MRLLLIIILIPFFISCSSYKEMTRQTSVDTSVFSSFDTLLVKTKNKSDLPRRLRKSFLFKSKSLTFDSSLFTLSTDYKSLITEAGYNKKKKYGYYIFTSRDTLSKKNICRVYNVINDSISFVDYLVPVDIITLNKAIPYLTTSNKSDRLFGGRLVDKKKSARIKRRRNGNK